MKKPAFILLPLIACAALSGCGKQESAPATTAQPAAEAPAAATAPANEPATTDQNATAATQPEAAAAAPAEAISETDDAAPATEQTSASVQPAVKLGGSATTAPTSANFKEGTNYQRLVPAQPTTVAPDKVEVVEVFWYGCGHCFRLDPAIESWRAKSKPGYVEFVRVPAMWNDTTRMHARLYYATELLGKGDELHSLIFREFHVNGNQLNTVEKIAAFFKQHGVGNEEFNKAFSSFAVESKLQRADFLNRRYRVQSVPMMVVNGKYTTDVGMAGSEPQLFALIGELAAHEHGG
jgi:protein dithiol oxidoreductase (disulfide-forming)